MASFHCRNSPCSPATSTDNTEPRPANKTSSATPESGLEPGPEPGPAPALVSSPALGLDPASGVAYTQADLQMLLRICMAVKELSND